MKALIISITLILLHFQFGFAQVFHFNDTSTTLIKTTSQSPAHWYIQVQTDLSIDTVLRWKCTQFVNVPSQWVINFDDQTTSYPSIFPGDSSDFVLKANDPYANKLIIGAMLNNTPGHAIIYFDIYDPHNPLNKQTISYEFIVTQSTNALASESQEDWLNMNGDFIQTTNGEKATFNVYSLSGAILLSSIENQINVSTLPKNQTFMLYIAQGSKRKMIKLLR